MDFIPLKYYFDFFINSALVMMMFTLLHTIILNGNESKVIAFNKIFGLLSFIILTLYIGLRPLSEYYFVDMRTYADIFRRYQYGAPIFDEGDFGFNLFSFLLAKVVSLKTYFLICAFLYIAPLYFATKKWFPNYSFFVFFMLFCSFSFYPYGVNGMRNGIATSFFILGISYRDKRILMVLWLFISIMFHKSMMLPLVVFTLANVYHNTKAYFMGWLASIFLSLTMGGVWVSLFISLGFGDDRLSGYLNASADADKFSSTGFRFDFLIYSALPILMGYYYVFKNNYQNRHYHIILRTYLLCNAFWVLVIRANFSNRFAYLSWFLMALVIFYPLFKDHIWKNQFKKAGYLMLAYFSVTYILALILTK